MVGRRGGNLQATGSKQETERNLLAGRNLKRKDNLDRKAENDDVNDDVGDTKNHHGGHVSDTLALDLMVPSSIDRSALEDDEEDVHDGVSANESHEAIDDSAEESIGADAEVEGEHRELGEGDGGGKSES